MKQYVTIKQFNELSESAQERFKEWLQDHIDDLRVVYEKNDRPMSSDGWPLLSIGKMIEFLDEHHKEITISKANGDWDYKADGGHYWHRWGQDLCDALWEAVKEVLETI